MSDKKLTRDELLEKAAKRVIHAYDSFSNRAGMEDKWRVWDGLYNLVLSAIGEGNYKGSAKTFTPATRRALQSVRDFVIDVLFPATSDWYRIVGVDGDADVKNAEVYKKIADLQDEKIGIRAKAIKMVERLLKYGFVIVRVPYKLKDKYIIKEEKERKDYKTKLKDFLANITNKWSGDDVPKKKAIAIYDNIDFEVKSPWNMYWNYGLPWEEQTIVIEKIDNVTASHLRAQKKKGIYNENVNAVIEELKEKKATGKISDETDFGNKFPHYEDITGLSGTFDDGVPRTKILQADVLFDIDQDGYDEWCIISVALTGKDTEGNLSGRCIRLDLNPCELQENPTLMVTWDELEDMSVGMGIPQVAYRDQMVLNDFKNQTLDCGTEILNCVRVYDEDALGEGQNLQTWPRKTIKMKGNPNELIAFIRPPNIMNEATNCMNLAKADIQDGSRASVALQGMNARYDTTGTEYTQMNNSGMRGLLCQIKKIEDHVLKPYKRFQYAYNEQFLSRETLIGILGRKAATALLKDPEDVMGVKERSPKDVIIGDYNFYPLGVTQTESKTIRAQQRINFLNIATKVEQMKPGTVNIPFLVSKIWDDLGDGDNRIILPQVTDPEIDPNIENVLLAQGGDVPVSAADNDDAHIQVHAPLPIIPEFAVVKVRHLKAHIVQKQKKELEAQAKMGQAGPGAPVRQQPNFQPKPPVSGGVPGVVNAPPIVQ